MQLSIPKGGNSSKMGVKHILARLSQDPVATYGIFQFRSYPMSTRSLILMKVFQMQI